MAQTFKVNNRLESNYFSEIFKIVNLILVNEGIFESVDTAPKIRTYRIIEMILQKQGL